MNQNQTTRPLHDSTGPALYVALELSSKTWLLAMSDGDGGRPRKRSVPAGDLVELRREVGKAKRRFSLPMDARVYSCYEAGRDGFWIHRALDSEDIVNLVVDSSSIEVNRKWRRSKTDRLDAEKLLEQLTRHYLWRNKTRVWSVVRIPPPEAEDERQLNREIEQLTRESTAYRNRIQGLLATQGVSLKLGRKFLEHLDEARLWNGEPLGKDLRARLIREHGRWQTVRAQIRELKLEMRSRMKKPLSTAADKAIRLERVRGIGEWSAWKLSAELFGWRTFANRRELGGAAGLVPAPWKSGDDSRDQGINKEGNARIRWLMIELGWCWLRYQPNSDLSKWFREKFGKGKRTRRVGIVGLARRLLIALWRYVEYGEMIAGAKLKY